MVMSEYCLFYCNKYLVGPGPKASPEVGHGLQEVGQSFLVHILLVLRASEFDVGTQTGGCLGYHSAPVELLTVLLERDAYSGSSRFLHQDLESLSLPPRL